MGQSDRMMTRITVRVPVQLAEDLRERAAAEGLSVSALVSRQVGRYLAAAPTPRPPDLTAYDVLKDFIGCCTSTDGADARNLKHEFAQYVVDKHAKGRL